MILFPAIDLKGGACVRLVRGEMASATVFNDDPAAQARSFAETGFSLAACRRSRRRLRRQVGQWRGGAGDPRGGRSADPARRRHPRPRRDRLLARLSASTGSCSAPPRCAIPSWCAAPPREHPGRIVVGIDARDGRVAVEGWAETSDVGAVELGAALRRCRGGGDRLHRHRPRRRADRDRCGGDRRLRAPGRDPGHRLGRRRLARRYRGAEGARGGRHRRRDLRPRAL